MKKELLYLAGGILIGGASGASIAYILTKRKYEKKINEELDRIKEKAKNDVDQAKIDAINTIAKENLIVKKPTVEELKEEERVLRDAYERQPKKEPVDYSKFYSRNEEVPNGDDTCDEDIGSELYPVEDEDKIPYFIDEDAIDGTYDIVCLTYYEADHTLADDVSAQIVLPEDTVSVKLLDQFVNSDEDQTYICRDSHSTVYEITRYPGSYSQEILGLPDEYGGGEDGSDIDT